MSSAITPLELTSALVRRRNAGDLTDSQFLGTIRFLREDREYWRPVEVTSAVLGRAEEVIRTTALRALDAVHIASCLIFAGAVSSPVAFVTADSRQRAAAERAQLEVVWLG